MNEDFLPDNYKIMAQTQTEEEYIHNLFSHASFARDHIQHYINYIRENLEGISFPCSNKLDKETRNSINSLKKKRDEQLEALKLSEIAIKEDVNKLLNAMAGSVNYNWDVCSLGKIVGFQIDTISCSDNLIPLPIQSLYYVSSLTYGYLVEHAIKAMILNHKVDLIVLSIKKGNEFKEAIQADKNRLDDIENKLYVHDKNEAYHYMAIKAYIDHFYKSTKRNKLTQKDCANVIYNVRNDFLKKG